MTMKNEPDTGMSVDLHMHSSESDGSITLDDLLDEIVAKDIKVFSITEHDKINHVEKISDFAERNRIHYIPGIEMNARYEGYILHILGYGIDHRNKQLRSFLTNNSVDFGQKTIRYPDPEEVINVILCANGVPVLAHTGAPFYDPDYQGLIEKMLDFGIQGLECYHPQNCREITEYCVQICRNKNLVITGGSDYHGDCVPDRKLDMLGLTLGDVSLKGLAGFINRAVDV